MEQRDIACSGMPTSVMLPTTDEAYKALEKKLLRKVDWRLMPVLICMIVLKYAAQSPLPTAIALESLTI